MNTDDKIKARLPRRYDPHHHDPRSDPPTTGEAPKKREELWTGPYQPAPS